MTESDRSAINERIPGIIENLGFALRVKVADMTPRVGYPTEWRGVMNRGFKYMAHLGVVREIYVPDHAASESPSCSIFMLTPLGEEVVSEIQKLITKRKDSP